MVDAVLSTDGDCVILGVKKSYFNVNFNNETFQCYERAVDMMNKERNPMFKYDVIIGL